MDEHQIILSFPRDAVMLIYCRDANVAAAGHISAGIT